MLPNTQSNYFNVPSSKLEEGALAVGDKSHSDGFRERSWQTKDAIEETEIPIAHESKAFRMCLCW